jgi:hypothetical protein
LLLWLQVLHQRTRVYRQLQSTDHHQSVCIIIIGEDSSLDLFFDEFLSVTDPIKIKILLSGLFCVCAWSLLCPTQNCFFVAKVMEKNWQGLQNIMLYRATAGSLAYIGEDSSAPPVVANKRPLTCLCILDLSSFSLKLPR